MPTASNRWARSYRNNTWFVLSQPVDYWPNNSTSYQLDCHGTSSSYSIPNKIYSPRDIYVTVAKYRVSNECRARISNPHPYDPRYLDSFGDTLHFISSPPGG